MPKPNLLPCPRLIRRLPGACALKARSALLLDAPDAESITAARRLQAGANAAGIHLSTSGSATSRGSRRASTESLVRFTPLSGSSGRPESCRILITGHSVRVEYADAAGLRAAVATLRQLLREHGRQLPRLEIVDWPDFPRRGVMLDVSRGRVPRLSALLELVDRLADFKINEFQLYLEHTFAYRNYHPVWKDWGALTGAEIRALDARCKQLGIDLVPNQNSFGHLRQWLEYAPLRKLGEVRQPYREEQLGVLRFPSTLAPRHRATLPFLRGLYDELLPNFSSEFFNVGCDETWDLGRGQSKAICQRIGAGRVYLDFLKAIRREVTARGRRMMFWGDIILEYPELIDALPKDMVALNWGYEAGHPFEVEAAAFARAGLRFYVCPGTSTWMTLIGRHDNAMANLRAAAAAGVKHGASGYLITDWGDGGHPQPLVVSFLPYLAGAALAWCAETFNETQLVPVLSRDVFHDGTGRLAQAALALGFAHRKFQYAEPNCTPFGTTLAAPPAGVPELFCRNGLKNYQHIRPRNIRAALAAVEEQLRCIRRARPSTPSGRMLAWELELAGRMAAQSCKFMLWQQARASGRDAVARRLARAGIRELRLMDQEFNGYWNRRNKGTTKHCSAFLQWRRGDYSRGQA